MYTFKVYEVNELFESIRKAEKLGFSRRLFLVYGINVDQESNLKVNENLELKSDTSYIFKVIRFVLIRKIPYITNSMHIVIEPISINAVSQGNAELCNLIDKGILRHTIDFENVMKMSIPSSRINNEIKHSYLFYTIQKYIDIFDPYGLFHAPIDEYDDLSSNVLSVLLKADDYHKKYNDLVRIISDYSFMDIKSIEEVNRLVIKLLEIDVKNFGNMEC